MGASSCSCCCRADTVDNVAWVAKHKMHVEGKAPNQVFSYVKDHHPLMGCARRVFPQLTGTERMEELARLADAVCIACVDHPTMQTQLSTPFSDYLALNATAIGNFAYVALNSKNDQTRIMAQQHVDKWRATLASENQTVPEDRPFTKKHAH